MRPMNICIDSKAFASLILDYEYAGDEVLPPYVSGRVLFDGCFHAHITGTSRADLINKFRSGDF